MRVVAFGTYDVTTHPRVGVLIEGLRDNGHDVVEINRRLGLSTAQRVELVRQPWRLPALLWRLAVRWAVLLVLGLSERRRRPDAVLVGYLGHFDVLLARLAFGRGVPIALDHLVSAAATTDDRGLTSGGGLKRTIMTWIDRSAVATADVVILDTSARRDSIPPRHRSKVVTCPVGATDEWFAAGAARSPSPDTDRLTVVFVGLFTPLHGTSHIAEALDLLREDPRIQATIVGRGQDYEVARMIIGSSERVRWIPWVEAAELPTFVAGHDVSLGIFGTTAKALEVVPTKVYQGAAAGCVIVTSDTAPQRAALSDAAVLVPPGDAASLAETLAGLADAPERVRALADAARSRAGERFTPAACVRPLVRVLEQCRAARQEESWA